MPLHARRQHRRDEMENLSFPAFPFIEDDAAEPAISVHFEEISFDFPQEPTVSAWLFEVAASEKKAVGEVSYIFCSDDYLHKINVEYLDHDDLTDVITFPYSDSEIAGDVFISIERVRENADSVGVPFLHELCRIMVHGLLHLAGLTDKTAQLRAAMTAKEDFYLARLGLDFNKTS